MAARAYRQVQHVAEIARNKQGRAWEDTQRLKKRRAGPGVLQEKQLGCQMSMTDKLPWAAEVWSRAVVRPRFAVRASVAFVLQESASGRSDWRASRAQCLPVTGMTADNILLSPHLPRGHHSLHLSQGWSCALFLLRHVALLVIAGCLWDHRKQPCHLHGIPH